MLNAPRKNPASVGSPTSPSPGGVSKGPLHDSSPDNHNQTVPTAPSLVMHAITPKLYRYAHDNPQREDMVFHFSFSSNLKPRAITMLDALKDSYSLKQHGCYISKGCFWEQCMRAADEDLNWIVTLKVRNPSTLLLNIICEYALSQDFVEIAVYTIPWRKLTVVKCEYKLK